MGEAARLPLPWPLARPHRVCSTPRVTFSRPLFASLALAVTALAACGGATTSDVGSTGQAGQAGQGQAGQGQAGQGQAGQGQAGQGQAGQGQAGKAGAPPSWAACTAPGQCVVAPASCCGSCGAPTPGDMEGVNQSKLSEHATGACPGGQGCPACFMETSKDLLGVCRASTCQAIEVSKDAISACGVDADCVVRAGCCDCQLSTEKSAYTAVSKAGLAEYTANACGAGVDCGCPSPSVPKFKAVCGATKHCEVVPAGGVSACPAIPPSGGGACPSVGLECEYGESLIASCRVRATCGAAGWMVQLAKCPATHPAGQDGCPSSVSANGSACDPKLEGQVCDMGGSASCLCSSCLGGPCSQSPRWGCAAAPAAPCPALAPNAGQPCPSEGAACNYGVICSTTGARKLCKGGVWVNDLIACAN